MTDKMMKVRSDLFPGGGGPAPGSVHERYVAERLAEVGRWGTETLASHVRRHAAERPDRIAYTDGTTSLTWSELDKTSDQLAVLLRAQGLVAQDRVALFFPDSPTVHALYLATEKAGLVAVGIGPRAGYQELKHLVEVTGARLLVTAPSHLGQDTTPMADRLGADVAALRGHVTIDPADPERVVVDGRKSEMPAADTSFVGQQVGDVFMINSTSGTTGLPKCVVHNQSRWYYFHEQVLRTASLSAEDVWLALVPAPYGFGFWTSHVTPIVLGATTVVQPRFNAEKAIELIEQHRVTVMACVTTQFIKLLNSEDMADADLTSLRAMYTGGEAIPTRRAEQFEDRTGARVLNFYGSNETGLLSYTRSDDPTPMRLGTAGRVDPGMDVVLLDEAGTEVSDGPGRSACRGPATSLGYYADDEANAGLFTPDGRMLTGDLCTVDGEGYLRVVGRTSDFIIRGGKNVSAAAVEEQVGAHPSVAVVAAVGVPDEVFGERIRAVVELLPGARLELDDLKTFLDSQEVSKELWPEQLEIVAHVPVSAGKVAKGEIRKRVRAEAAAASGAVTSGGRNV